MRFIADIQLNNVEAATLWISDRQMRSNIEMDAATHWIDQGRSEGETAAAAAASIFDVVEDPFWWWAQDWPTFYSHFQFESNRKCYPSPKTENKHSHTHSHTETHRDTQRATPDVLINHDTGQRHWNHGTLSLIFTSFFFVMTRYYGYIYDIDIDDGIGLSTISLETKSCRILPLTYVTKYDWT